MFKKKKEKCGVWCGAEVAGEEIQMQAQQAVTQGIPHFPQHHASSRARCTPMQQLVIVSVSASSKSTPLLFPHSLLCIQPVSTAAHP